MGRISSASTVWAAGVAAATVMVAAPVAVQAYSDSHAVAADPTGAAQTIAATAQTAGKPAIGTPPDESGLAARAAAALVADEPGSTAGIEVANAATGSVITSLNANEGFYSASVVKLLIAMDTFQGANWNPDQATASQVQTMLSKSDDDIADDLWDTGGSDAVVTRMIAAIGLTGTKAPDDPDEWGETVLTAADVVTIYRYLDYTVPEPARTLIRTALADAARTAADGTDQYFGIPDALSTAGWAVKQGWMYLDNSTTLDTTGLVGPTSGNLPYILVVLTSMPGGIEAAGGGPALTAAVAQLAPAVTG